MKEPFFSFVIPCYKAADTISQCLGSIFDQDFKDFEVICVLDGPDDSARMIIESFDVKCEVIEKSGVCKARNRGLELAKGKYILFSDCDFVWSPGILRSFKEKIDSTGADFVFSGYRWIDQPGGHIPPEFDEHLITVSNICDGSNPVKTELVRKVGGWDESLERFQDWDLWIRVVRAGGRGVKVEENAKETFFPKSGDISGKDNYEEAYKRVRNKHGIDRKVCLTSLAAPGHALRVAKLCGWDFWHDPTMLPNKYDAMYLVGCFPESIEDHVKLFADFRNIGMRESRYIIHWIGTDVLNMRMMIPFLQIKAIRDMFTKKNVIHLVQSEENKREMEELGFTVTHLPLPVEPVGYDLDTPKKFSIACYDHNGQDKKWHKWVILEVAKAMPDVQFLFFGNKNFVGKDKNIEWCGTVDMKELMAKSNCLLRLTIHDGYPVSPIEFMYSGRRVITNVKDMPFTDYIDLGLINDDRAEEIKGSLIKKIREVQRAETLDKKKIMDYYHSILDPERFKKTIEDLVYVKN